MPIIRILPGGRFSLNSAINIAINGARLDIPVGEIVTVSDEVLQIIRDTGATFTYGDGALDGDVYADTLAGLLISAQSLLTQAQQRAIEASTSATSAGISASGASDALTAAQAIVTNLAGSVDLTDALTKIAAFVIAGANGISPLTVNLDGSVDVDVMRSETIDALSITSTRRVIQTALGQEAAQELGVDAAAGAGLVWAIQIGAALALAVNEDGSADIDLLRSEIANITNLFTSRLFLQDALGSVAGRVEPLLIEDAMAGVVDSGSVSPFMVNSDGSIDLLQDDAARFSGNALVTSKVVLRTKMTGFNRRSVTAHWRDGSGNDGLTTTLADDVTADYSVAGFDDTTGRALLNRRMGDWQQTYSIDAAVNNGALSPIVSSRDLFMDGDSFNSVELRDAIMAALTDKNRNFEISGSGGSWLTSHLAVLAGPATPSGVGADGGVVPASQVGSSPTRAGGVARTTITGRIDNGTPGNVGNILTVTAIAAGGPIQVGDQVIITTGSLTVGAPPTVMTFGTGGTTGTGGVGTYQLSNTANVPAGTVYAGPWTYPGLKQFLNRTLIIMDGGLDDFATDGQSAVIARIIAFGQALTPLAKRWYYVQAGIDRASSPAAVTAYLALQAAIKAGIGASHYIDTYDYMRSHGTGSTTGSGGGAVWAADNYADSLHPSSMGKTNLGACIAAAIEAKGN